MLSLSDIMRLKDRKFHNFFFFLPIINNIHFFFFYYSSVYEYIRNEITLITDTFFFQVVRVINIPKDI